MDICLDSICVPFAFEKTKGGKLFFRVKRFKIHCISYLFRRSKYLSDWDLETSRQSAPVTNQNLSIKAHYLWSSHWTNLSLLYHNLLQLNALEIEREIKREWLFYKRCGMLSHRQHKKEKLLLFHLFAA